MSPRSPLPLAVPKRLEHKSVYRGRVIRERDALGLLDGEAVTLRYEDLPNGTQRTTVTYPPRRQLFAMITLSPSVQLCPRCAPAMRKLSFPIRVAEPAAVPR